MTEEGDKPAPTAEQEVLEDTDKPDQPVQANPPAQNATETEKETETPKPDNKTIVENRPAPTKTGKMVVCRVIMLDARTEDIEVDKGAEGKVLFDKVCKSIKLQEVEYFGLTYVGARDVKFWLSMDKKISKQLKGDRWVFEFAVKFYPPEPSFLLHDYTKYLLCLQVRIDVFNGRLPCSVVTHAILGAYTVQADIGDYESPREGRSEIDYLRDFDFAPTPSEELLHKIFDLHKTLKGMEDVDAEELFLENAKKLAMYGVDLHKAKDSQNVNILLGVCASGVTIYKDKLRINRFVWPKILKLSYKRSNFYIKLRPVEGDTSENSICFKLENHKMAKLVWKTCVEHHAFFRLKEAEPPRKGTNFPRFNSKFRYSGRTQKQIQDSAKTLDKQKEPFERRPIKRPDANYIDRNSDHPLDEKDRLDQMHRDPAMISSTGPPPYSQDADRLNQAESRADKPGYLPGEAEDRLDKEQDQTATLERRPIESEQTDADVGPGITPVGRKSKRSKEEKEREKREKEEEKRRKKEEEKRRKQQEKENKKKKDLEKSTTEDRTDKLGPDDATLTAGGVRPESAELQHEGITLAVTAPVGDGSPEKDNEKDKDKETDGEKEPSSPTTKEGKGKSKKDKKKDKKGDKHKDDKEKDDKEKDDKDRKGSKKGKGLFGSGKKPKRSDSKSKQSDSEPSSPVSPGFDATTSPTSPPGGTMENQEVQGHTEVTSAEDESGQDKGLVKEIDNSKSNGRKKEVKFIDECESDKTEEELNSKQTNNVIEHVTEEIKPAVVKVVNTMPENTITTSNSEKQAVIEHDGQELSEIKAINIVTQENTQEKKGDKSSEQVIPDENIEDEVFETEAESVEKTKEIKEDTKEETQKETEIQVDEVSKTEINPDIEVINEEKENIIVTKNESEVCDNNDKVDLKENNIEVLFGKELEKEAVKVEEDKVNEVSASPKEVSNIADKLELQGEEVNKEQEVDEPKVVNADEENEKKKEQREVVVNPGEVIEECVDKGEVILPVVVATEEAGNNQHEENDVEVTGADGGKEEDKVDEKEQKRLENEAQKKQKEEIKKEKERIKKEKQEKKRLEKEEKKKEKELKKKLDKEKKEKEKQMKKSKKSSSVSPAVEEIKENECQGQTDAEAPPPSPVDPVQVELAVALQQRKKQNDEENNETKQDVNEPVESPENTLVQETNKTQECVKPSQEEAKDQPSQENVSSQDTDKPLDSSTPPEQEREATEKAEGGEESKQDQENGTKVEAVKPKKSKKEKKEKPKKEKKDKKKKHDSTGCFAFIKKPKKSESDEEPAPVEDMPTEPWNKDKQEEQEAVTEEVVQEEKVTPKQRGVGLGWALPAFEEMKERQAAAAAAREAKPAGSENEKPRSCSLTSLKSSSSSSSSDERVQRVPQAPLADLSEGLSVEAGLDGEGEWPVDREGSIDRKMQFIAVTPPTTETKDMNGVPEEGGMPFFDPLGGSDVNGEPVKVKKVPPPVPPKGVRGSSDLDNMSEEDRLRYMGADGLPPTVATESMKYAPDTDETPIATTNFPTVKTETRTVTYEKDGIPVAIEDGILISSQSHSTRTQTIETTTYKTERDGMVETRMEKKVIISDDNNDIDHDQLLADAIRAVTEMDQNMSVEKIECTRQIEN